MTDLSCAAAAACGQLGAAFEGLEERWWYKACSNDALLRRCPSVFDRDLLYAELEGIAQFGPESVFSPVALSRRLTGCRFKRLQKAAVNEHEALLWIKGHADGLDI